MRDKMHLGTFVVIMPDEEFSTARRAGNTDILLSHPILDQRSQSGQPLVETYPVHGKVYHEGSAPT
jgi:hypothetical protein